MASRRLFLLAERVKAEEDAALMREAEAAEAAAWFDEARRGGGVSV